MKYRDNEHDLEKKDGVYRIFFIGDSFTYGLFIDNPNEVFPKVIEKKLHNQTSLKIETINAGQPGFDIFQEVDRFNKQGKNFNPDLVVLGLNFDEANVYHIPLEDPNINIPSWIKISRLYQIVIGSNLRSQAEAKYRNYMFSIYSNKNSKEWKTFENQLLKLKNNAKSINAETAIILFTPIYPRQPNRSYDFYIFNSRLKEFGKDNNVYIIDPLDKVLKYKNKEKLIVSPLDAHPTVEMNRLIAETFTEQLPASVLFKKNEK